MAMHDVAAVEAYRDELGEQLVHGAMRFVWTSLGGLNHLMDYHGDGFNLAGAEHFLQRRLTCAEQLRSLLQKKLNELGDTEAQDDRQVFLEIRRGELQSDEGHPPNRLQFVLNYLDDVQNRGGTSMLNALQELLDVLDALLLHFARIRSGSSANDAPARLETTGPPEPRVLRLRSSSPPSAML